MSTKLQSSFVLQPVLHSSSREAFRKHLLRWFDREKRNLPWRGDSDPYRILVSEIMLQQTRVAVVKERYKRFLQRFPSISRLARAAEESVLAEWSGLGYYRRARALHAAARHIHRQGVFPKSAAELMELPGIGRYTAAAVASIAFGEPAAVVDGNVKRVLQRLSGKSLSDDACWQAAEGLLARNQPGDFNQALMELGATVCLPGQPVCHGCPVVKFCSSSTTGVKKSLGAEPPAQRKKATLGYVLARKNGAVLLHQRPANVSLMPGMWELPQIKPSGVGIKNPALKLRHSITTTDYTVFVLAAQNRKRISGSWIHLNRVGSLPLTGLARKILNKLELLR